VPPLQCNAPPLQRGGRNNQSFSRKWDWLFGVEEGGGEQDESMRNNQGFQLDSIGGLLINLTSKAVVVIKNHRAVNKMNQCATQGFQCDSMGGCVDRLNFIGSGGNQESQGNGSNGDQEESLW
jgi:hypothetical protein